ncbi:hypothetical protein HYW94_04210 [Candidatus Uhrbacteria bacterium]|nr:hypothetical protein [Candidatus Uhrbacteria bacterium]
MSIPQKLIPPQLNQQELLREISVKSFENYEQKEEFKQVEIEKTEKKKSSGVERIREGLRKKRKKASFEYSERIIDFDKLNKKQQSILSSVVDPRSIDAHLPHSQTEAEVREFYHMHLESRWAHLKDALWFLTFGPFIGTEKAIQRDLRHIRKEQGIDVAYYPGSGYDVVPRDALGSDRVIHLSLEGQDSYYRMKHTQDDLRGYEKRDMELVGDYRSSPLKDASVDTVIVKGLPIHSAVQAVPDFKRVMKDDGILLFIDDRSMVGTDFLEKEINKEFIKIRQKGCIAVYRKRTVSQ